MTQIDFEQELYNTFGQVKDFTLGMRIAKWFYDMGKNSQESVSEDLQDAAINYKKILESANRLHTEFANIDFVGGALWQKEQMMAKAVDATIEEPEPLLWRVLGELEGLFVAEKNLHDGDGVKVIIIKED